MTVRKLSFAESDKRFSEMAQDEAFQPCAGLPSDAIAVRDALLSSLSQTVLHPRHLPALAAGREAYKQDVCLGMALQSALHDAGWTMRDYADDDAWRYLALCVVPDIVLRRVGRQDENRFWKSRRRMALKRAWWYVHLSWQGDEAATAAALEGATTDTIVQVVERPGKRGYRVELLRKIMMLRPRYSPSESQFRCLVRLNTALLRAIDPESSEGRFEGYTERLYAAVGCQMSRNGANP